MTGTKVSPQPAPTTAPATAPPVGVATDPPFTPRLPRREWLVRCYGEQDELGVCSIVVERGRVVIYDVDDRLGFQLEDSAIGEYRAALLAAIDVAAADVTQVCPGS